MLTYHKSNRYGLFFAFIQFPYGGKAIQCIFQDYKFAYVNKAENNMRHIRTHHHEYGRMFLLATDFVLLTATVDSRAEEGVRLYTPYTKITVSPGETVDYSIDLINNTDQTINVDISISGMPKGWNYILKSGSWNVQQISVLPKEKKSLSLKVEVPLKVNTGTYRFRVVAGGVHTLPLALVISEQGTYKTEFVTNQPNMEGQASSTFTFNLDLKNRTADKQLYALMSDAPRGWTVSFKWNYKQVTSVNVEANSTEKITVEIKPPAEVQAGKYKIPVRAVAGATSDEAALEVVITGTYGMELTTPTGLLSASVTAGKDRKIELVLRNTGSAELRDVELKYSAPANWEVIYNPKRVDRLASGEEIRVFATIKADKKAIPGDYVTNLEARTPEISSKASFRMAVKTPLLWGWVGVLIIATVLSGVYYLFRKYGRR